MVTRTIWGRGAAGAELPERLVAGTEVASRRDRTGRRSGLPAQSPRCVREGTEVRAATARNSAPQSQQSPKMTVGRPDPVRAGCDQPLVPVLGHLAPNTHRFSASRVPWRRPFSRSWSQLTNAGAETPG